MHLHCDATQAFGKIAIDAVALGVDTMSVSGHKFYGPPGSGALYLREAASFFDVFGEVREMAVRYSPEMCGLRRDGSGSQSGESMYR